MVWTVLKICVGQYESYIIHAAVFTPPNWDIKNVVNYLQQFFHIQSILWTKTFPDGINKKLFDRFQYRWMKTCYSQKKYLRILLEKDSAELIHIFWLELVFSNSFLYFLVNQRFSWKILTKKCGEF